MKRFSTAKLTTRFHYRNSKRTCTSSIPVTVPAINKNIAQPSTSGGLGAAGHDHENFPHEFPVNALSEHEQRSISSLNNWAAIRGQCLTAYVNEMFLPPNAVCIKCRQNHAVIRCQNCGPQVYLCHACCEGLHATVNHYHTPEIWKNGTFMPLIIVHKNNIVKLPYHGINCHAPKETREIIVIDIQGNHHFKQIEFCSCEKVSISLLRFGLWPGSPERPRVAFTLELMEMLRLWFIHCKVSLNEMIEVLDLKREPLLPKLTSSLYSILNSGCFEEYRMFHHNVDSLNSFDERLYNGTWCPMCPQDNGILIESMDACFGLYRKKTKGTGSQSDTRYKNEFFADQNDVDNFINNYKTTSKVSDLAAGKECSNFHAGEVEGALRSKGKNKLLDEKGVFGRVCRHDFPKGFLNIKHGERISYSVYECKRILEENQQKSNTVIIMYDIACILSAHIKKNPVLKDLSSVPLAIPIFHNYGHKASCQVQYSPRRTKLLGLTDGEGTERLWAFLRDYSRITKEMGTHKRVDVLTDGLRHYGKQVLAKQIFLLKNRLNRAQELKEKNSKELQELIASLPASISYSTSTMENLISQEHEEIQNKKQGLNTSWDEEYVDLLEQDMQLRHIMSSSDDANALEKSAKRKERVVKSIQAIEKSNGIRKRWTLDCAKFAHSKKQLYDKRRKECLLEMHSVAAERMFLLELKRKYADGQAVAKKVSKTLDQATSSLKKLLCRCNTLTVSSSVTDIPFDEAKNPMSYIYSVCQSSPSVIPSSHRHKLIEAHCLHERCEEEVDLLHAEIRRLSEFYDNQISVLEEASNSLQVDSGVRSLLQRKKLLVLETAIQLKATLPQLSNTPAETHTTYEVSSDETCVFPTRLFSSSQIDDDKLFVMSHEHDLSSDDEESDDDDNS